MTDSSDSSDLLARTADTLALQQLLATYARAVDTRDWDLYRSLFTPDAQIDYTSAPFGIAGQRDEVAAWLEQSLSVVPMSMHYVSNIEVDLDGDSATVHAQFYNPMQFPGFAELSFCGGYYHHQMVRTPDGWRSRGLREENLWFVNSPTPPA